MKIFVAAFFMSFCLFLFNKQMLAQAPSQTGKANVNGISLAYERFGLAKAEAILLISGTGAQLTMWPEELCRQLAAEGFQVIRFDNRDVGLSSHLDSLGMPDWAAIIPKIGSCDSVALPYSLQDMARDAVGLLDALSIEKAHIVGASMGGAIAQLLAIHYPNRALSLTSIMASSGNSKLPQGDPQVLGVMAAPPPQTDQVDSLAQYLMNIYRAIGSPAYPTPDNVVMDMARQNVLRAWDPMGSARQAAAVIIGDNCDRRPLLKKLRMPVVILHGEQDPVVRVAAAHELAATIPQAELILIPGMGHDLPAVLVPRFRDAILKAVRE